VVVKVVLATRSPAKMVLASFAAKSHPMCPDILRAGPPRVDVRVD